MTNQELEKYAKSVRKRIVQFKTKSGYGHLSTSLSPVDILVSLYNDPETNFDHTKDKLFFGKAHGSPAVYPILADLHYFEHDELDKYCTKEGILRLHSDWTIPGCNFIGGSLGNAIGYVAGCAYANRDKKYYIILGDGELYEGSVWESLMFIAHHNLKNITMIVDRNQMSTIGKTEDLLRLESIEKKFSAFGMLAITIDGHNYDQLRAVFSMPEDGLYEPLVVIAKTIKGKGVSYMEGRFEYHNTIPKDPALIKQALEELS
jgi:transketolase